MAPRFLFHVSQWSLSLKARSTICSTKRKCFTRLGKNMGMTPKENQHTHTQPNQKELTIDKHTRRILPNENQQKHFDYYRRRC
eukprot:3539323-Amphidinium_carterae.1